MKHIFFIDPLEKLTLKKDSTLMLALSFQSKGHECYILFEKDFYITNNEKQELTLYPFEGEFKEDGCYLKSFKLAESKKVTIDKTMTIHMRVDPPYDTRYQRYLWMLDFLQEKTECEILNSPLKIMKYNEKLVAYKDLETSHESYIGSSLDGFNLFIEQLKRQSVADLILKPLDLYSGIGVEKVSITDPDLIQKFQTKVEDFNGAIVCQPFVEDIYNGEYRSIYFDGKEVGTIIKKPVNGEFLANIAQGAVFEKAQLPEELNIICNNIARDLYEDGVRFIAFDLLGGKVNEINITCPGLLVEVSYAFKKNLCFSIIDQF